MENNDSKHVVSGLLGQVKKVNTRKGPHLYGYMQAWRLDDGPLSREPIYWRIETSNVRFDPEAFQSWSAVKLRVLRKVAANGYVQFQVLEVLEIPYANEELEAIAKELNAPVVVPDSVLGELRWDPSNPADFTGEALWGKSPVQISLANDNGAPSKDGLSTLHQLFKDQALWDTRLRQAAADAHLTTYNEHGRHNGETALERAEFVRHLSLKALIIDHTVGSDGFIAWVDDGKLFGGHPLVATGSIRGGIEPDVTCSG